MAEGVALSRIPCELCSGSSTGVIYEKFGLPIARCSTCGLVFANPRLPPSETAKRYSDDYFSFEYLRAVAPPRDVDVHRFLTDRYGPVFELLPRPDADARLLEVGSGAGFLLKSAEIFGWNAYGVEYSAAAARYAERSLGLRIVRATAAELPFAQQSFDAALMFDVIEHLHHPLSTLEELRRCLRTGGHVLIMTPNFRALSRAVLGDQWAVLSPAEHLFYFTESTLRRLLNKAGFVSVRFVRRHRPWGPFETMNPRYTHSPRERRARMYEVLVSRLGRFLHRTIQSVGFADALLAIAKVP